MRAVVTRVDSAQVTVDGQVVGEISKGLLVLLGVSALDTPDEADRIADRLCGMRIFQDRAGRMNIPPAKAGAEMLFVSQFTLCADCRSRRPSFSHAAASDIAEPLYERCIAQCRERGFKVETGVFGADMIVSSVNNGPVTFILDTDEL